MPDRPFTQTLVDRLARARHVAVLTGAGVSAESGIPTFRDPGGLWDRFEPQELANVEAFLQNTDLVQRWYAHRRSLALETRPNPAHEALAALERLVPACTLVTQNVDGLHQRAGSRHVIELHGNITRNYCINCEREAVDGEMTSLAEGSPARCPACEGYIRPDVVWFGEQLPEGALEAAHAAAQEADVFLSIGTSAGVYPAAGLPLTAATHDAYVAEINTEPSAIAGEVDEIVLGKAGQILPALIHAMQSPQAS